MGKPSIFSRDYEKKMKRRKRRIMLLIIAVIVIVSVVFIKFKLPNIDFTDVKTKIQAWVDTGKPKEEIDVEEEKEQTNEEEEKREPEKTYMDLNLAEGVVVKAEYQEVEGVKKFITLVPVEGLTYTLSPSAQQIIVVDSAQNIKLCGIDGTVKDITKKEYISTTNQSFAKDQILANNPTYVWHSQVKFIDETKILYVSQLPYFGSSANNKYIWIYDIASGVETTLWNTKSQDIIVGDLVPEKGITVTIAGVVNYINNQGVITQ